MNRKERVKRAFHFNKPDRVPLSAFSFESDFYPIESHEPISWQPKDYPPHVDGGAKQISTDVFRRDIYNWNDDLRKKLRYSEKWWEYPHESIDEYQVIWRSSGTKSEDKTMGHPIKGPLEDNGLGEGWDTLDNFKFPDANDLERYHIIKTGKWKSLAEDRYLVGAFGSGGLFSRCSYMRGFSAFLIDLARGKYANKTHQLINSILIFFLNTIEKLKDSCDQLDSIMMADDFGTQHSAFISPKIFQKYFKEPYKKMTKLAHELNMDFILHSCGNIMALIPELIDVGIDVLEFDSPQMTGVENFKQFAEQRKIAFWLCSNIQSTYILGDPKEVEEEIKFYIKEIGNNEGGLAIWEYDNNDSIGTPKKNIRAQRKAVFKYGNYNEKGIIDWLA
ncbi:MAG TPA: uroporphyrinogen decarboxylase family protein [Candidatus Lokiarchaeia archaeon]